jgi:hypothetical protein
MDKNIDKDKYMDMDNKLQPELPEELPLGLQPEPPEL